MSTLTIEDTKQKENFGYDGYYYDKDTGALVKNSFVSLEQPSGTLIYYLDNEGNTIKREQIINGKHLNFGEYGIQVKGNFAPNGLFYDAITGEPVTNRYVQINDQSNSYNTLENKDKWFYIGSDSKALKGEQVINGVTVFFDKDGVQAKGISQMTVSIMIKILEHALILATISLFK